MNKKENLRKRETKERIHQALLKLVRQKDVNKITVSDICNEAQIHRTTFYGHYLDVLDLTDHVTEELNEQMIQRFDGTSSTIQDGGFEMLFQLIQENKEYFQLYFLLNQKIALPKLPEQLEQNLKCLIDQFGYDDVDELQYHQDFFTAGLTAIITKWVNDGCDKSVSYMTNIIVKEYTWNKDKFLER